jgi:hypothetical protein
VKNCVPLSLLLCGNNMNGNHWKIKKEDYYKQIRYRGHIYTIEPMAFLIKVYDQNGFGYTGVPKSDFLEREVDCYFTHILTGGVQVILRIDDAVNSLVVWRGKPFDVHESGSFTEGHPFTLAHFEDGQPSIHILAISTTKLRELRKRIWRVKDQYIDSIPEANKEILMKSRHGYVRAT